MAAQALLKRASSLARHASPLLKHPTLFALAPSGLTHAARCSLGLDAQESSGCATDPATPPTSMASRTSMAAPPLSPPGLSRTFYKRKLMPPAIEFSSEQGKRRRAAAAAGGAGGGVPAPAPATPKRGRCWGRWWRRRHRADPLPPPHLRSRAAGKAVFAQALAAGTANNFFKLIEQFRTQDEPAFCGLASLAMVLNTLSIDPRRTWKGPWRWFHEEMLDCCLPLDAVREEGITLAQVRGGGAGRCCCCCCCSALLFLTCWERCIEGRGEERTPSSWSSP